MDHSFYAESRNYDLIRTAMPSHEQSQHQLGKFLSDTLAYFPDEILHFLEMGCGTGYTTRIIAAADPRVHVTAVDIAQGMIDQARSNLADFVEIGRVELIKADALEYVNTCPPELYAGFASAMTIHNFQQNYRNEFLQGVFKVLRPEGVFVNADKYAHDKVGERVKAVVDELWSISKTYVAHRDLNGACQWFYHCVADVMPARIMPEHQAIKQLQSIGFDVHTILRLPIEAVVAGCKKRAPTI